MKIANVADARLIYWPCVENNRAVIRPDGAMDVRLGDRPAPGAAAPDRPPNGEAEMKIASAAAKADGTVVGGEGV